MKHYQNVSCSLETPNCLSFSARCTSTSISLTFVTNSISHNRPRMTSAFNPHFSKLRPFRILLFPPFCLRISRKRRLINSLPEQQLYQRLSFLLDQAMKNPVILPCNRGLCKKESNDFNKTELTKDLINIIKHLEGWNISVKNEWILDIILISKMYQRVTNAIKLTF